MADEYPLVSAILLAGKADIKHVIKTKQCFLDQSYPNKELIIVNNAKNPSSNQRLYDLIENNIYVVDTPTYLNAGSARNFGVSTANGDLLAQFDANYWHHPDRLSIQILTLANNSSHASFLSETVEISFISGRLGYQRNPSQLILNSMVWVKPKKTHYPDVDNHEERGYVEALMKADYKVVKFSRPELMCKLYYSKYFNLDKISDVKTSPEHSEILKYLN